MMLIGLLWTYLNSMPFQFLYANLVPISSIICQNNIYCDVKANQAEELLPETQRKSVVFEIIYTKKVENQYSMIKQ